MLQEKLKELKLQLNYACYDKEVMPKLSKVWDSFVELETEVEKLLQHGVMQAEGSDGAEGAAVGNSAAGKGVCEDGKEHSWTTAPDNLNDVFCKKCYKSA